ncbi:MAG: 4Fe-4S dicluster domain-containing protein [Candidatus Fimivivens sp.]
MHKSKKIAKVGKDCVACGSCLKVCKFAAIKIVNGIKAEVNDSCVACGKCVKICPCCVVELVERGA